MEIFKYILPAFIVMMTAYLLFDRMLSSEEKKRKHELAKKNQDILTPIRLRAYERMMLLLERTNPATMVVDVIKPGMTCIEFQTQLLQNIRREFEHNYAQQIYVSNELWEAVSATRENLIKLVNTTAAHFNPGDTASKMAEHIIRIYAETEQTPTRIAIEILKTETSNQFFIK
jgi:Mg2+/citrate symporter